MIIPRERRTLTAGLAAVSGLGGAAVALHYFRLGLTLSHYDARGHLVVARRIFDSITPGWQQIGAVWLPLPHLLNALPVQIDAFYRTGASAVAVSVLCFAVATACIAWIVAALTESAWAGIAGASVFALNPNVLYLQSTPMTEPLFMALVVLSVTLLFEWTRASAGLVNVRSVVGGIQLKATLPHGVPAALVGWAFVLACLTRYEAWPVTIGALAAAIWVLWRNGIAIPAAVARVTAIAVYPGVAVAAFFVFSRIVVGAWFVDDFFVPENEAQGRPYAAFSEIVWGTRALSGYGVLGVATAGLVALAVLAFSRRSRAAAVLPLALVGTASVPFLAFVDGHPYRIRYMVPLIASEAICAGALAGLAPRRTRLIFATALIVLAAYELRPLDATAPMVLEAQWDRPNVVAREPVTRCLVDGFDRSGIMASMGSLGHYMQDLSRAGFRLGDFLHEGNGDIWLNALHDPRPYAGWVLIEERAEGGDMLAHLSREKPRFLDGFSRVCEGAGLALYRRHAAGQGARPDTRATSAGRGALASPESR